MSRNSRDEELFADALARPAPERAAFLATACAGDPPLLARLVALLAAHEQPESALVLPVIGRSDLKFDEPTPGDQISHYQLRQKIGEGGCGIVYLAEQEEPVRREVALKVIKAGMDTREVIARFGAERQALALMDHPGIAKVFDAGATASGRPYFAMELVRGPALTNYCDAQRLPVPARLELFMQVCDAVQHAHQKGIIHRDLKPSNLLVTGHEPGAVPKVIDFGIAKATSGRLTDATLVTEFDQFMGTPAYMSPEQTGMDALNVDTRTDVYALGVVLYELLAGQPPFDPKSLGRASREEMRRVIREVEPPRPSARLGALGAEERRKIAEARATDPARLASQLAGDLDWVVMKALEKEPRRRYETPAAFAADLARHLEDETVDARPASNAYRIGKFVRRHRLAVAAAAAVGLALAIGSVVSTWQALRARSAERVAEAERARAVAARVRAEELVDFMLGEFRTEVEKVGRSDLLDAVGSQATKYFDALEPADLSDHALVQQVKALRQIGESQVKQARYAEASASFIAAYRRIAAQTARAPANTQMLYERAQAEFYLGHLQRRQGKLDPANEWLTRYRDSTEQLQRLAPANVDFQREVIFGNQNLALVELDRGHLDAAQAGFSTALALNEKMVAANPGDRRFQFSVANAISWLGTVAEARGDFAGALARYRDQSARLEALVGKDPADTDLKFRHADSLTFQVEVLTATGQRALAREQLQRARATLDALVAHDARNRPWLSAALNAGLKDATLHYAEGRLELARQVMDELRPKMETLTTSTAGDRAYLGRLVAMWRLEALLRKSMGASDALVAGNRAVEYASRLISDGWVEDKVLGECALAWVITGSVADASGQPAVARQHWQRGLEVLQPRLADARNWRLLDPAARLAALVGDRGKARTLISRLDQLGYVPVEPWPDSGSPNVSAINSK